MRADQKIGACDADNLFIDGKFPVDAVGVTNRERRRSSRARHSRCNEQQNKKMRYSRHSSRRK